MQILELLALKYCLLVNIYKTIIYATCYFQVKDEKGRPHCIQRSVCWCIETVRETVYIYTIALYFK